jgi:hypothetical protein
MAAFCAMSSQLYVPLVFSKAGTGANQVCAARARKCRVKNVASISSALGFTVPYPCTQSCLFPSVRPWMLRNCSDVFVPHHPRQRVSLAQHVPGRYLRVWTARASTVQSP